MAKFRRKKVRERAENCCEYCQLPQQFTVLPHHVDHIRAKKHHGAHSMENTCLSCAHCNAAKGPNAAGFDPETGELVPLFNPREDNWNEHFVWEGPRLLGKTVIGRATVDVLNINDVICMQQRELLIKAGVFPSG